MIIRIIDYRLNNIDNLLFITHLHYKRYTHEHSGSYSRLKKKSRSNDIITTRYIFSLQAHVKIYNKRNV